jgi:hypothetical protein
MGQYFVIANLTKKEYLHPHRLGFGAKLWEISANNITRIFPLLLRKSSEGGGGDIQRDYPTAGRWAGDKIVVVGDYDKSGLYEKAKKNFREISKEVVKDYNDFIKEPSMKMKLEKVI